MTASLPPTTGALWRVRREDSSAEGSALDFASLAQAVADGVLRQADEVRGPADRRWLAIGDHPELAEHLPPVRLLKPRPAEEADFDLTPMIDVSFQLIIFFMITACFVVQKTLDMPSAPRESRSLRRYTLSELAAGNVVVTMQATGAITVDGQPVEPEGVQEAIRQAARGRDNPEMALDADDAVEHQAVVSVLDAAGGAQIEKVHFLRRAPPAGAAKPDANKTTKPVSKS